MTIILIVLNNSKSLLAAAPKAFFAPTDRNFEPSPPLTQPSNHSSYDCRNAILSIEVHLSMCR